MKELLILLILKVQEVMLRSFMRLISISSIILGFERLATFNKLLLSFDNAFKFRFGLIGLIGFKVFGDFIIFHRLLRLGHNLFCLIFFEVAVKQAPLEFQAQHVEQTTRFVLAVFHIELIEVVDLGAHLLF